MGGEEEGRWEGRRGGDGRGRGGSLSGGMERVKTSDNWERIARGREEERKGDEQGIRRLSLIPRPPTRPG